MKKKSFLDVAVFATVFAIFLTSSFDLVGSIKVMGFTVRAVYLFVLIGVGLTLYRWIKEKELILPEGFLFLGIWMIMILAFIPNSPFVIRNIGYSVWLLLNVSTIFFVVNFMNQDNMGAFIRVYLVSFFALSLLGIVQYITPQIGLSPLVVQQWWVPHVLPRVNAFTYEPSFFATYLLFGIPAMLILLARGNLAGIPKWLYYTMLAVDVTALMLCSSRAGIFLFLLFLGGFTVYVMVRWITERKLGLHLAMSFTMPLLVTAGVLLIMDMRLRQVDKDAGYAVYLRDTGLLENDVTKDNSLTIRIQMMKKTFEVFQKNPVIGVSLGGIAPWIATTRVSDITSNEQVKPFEGANVPLEVLAASGVIGFIVFCIFIFKLCRPLLKKWPDGAGKDYYLALFWGFALGFIMLVENQNILRPYVWTHIALMGGVILVLGRQSLQKKKGIAVAKRGENARPLSRWIPEFGVGWTPVSSRVVAILLLVVLCAVPSFAQTVLINPNAEGGFENGSTFSTNEWTVVNDGTNKWEVGTATKNGGLRGAYISNDGGVRNASTKADEVSHFYRDVTFPVDAHQILLRFDFRGTGLPLSDDMRIYLISTETTPVAGVSLSSGELGFYRRTDYDRLGDDSYLGRLLVIPRSAAGTTKRLVFSWRSNSGLLTDIVYPPGAIDNISLVSEGSVTSNGTGGGLWSSGATWTGGIVPNAATDNSMILTGDIVTADIDITVQNIVVSGTLEFESGTPRTIEATSDVIVDQGGIIRSPSTGSAFHKLIVSGSFFNNGIFDGSTNNSQAGIGAEFTASADELFSGTGAVTDISSITVNAATTTATVLIDPDNLTVQGSSASGFLNLVKGTARIGGDFPLESVIFTSTSPTIATSTALWLDNPNLNVKAQNGNVTVNGKLEVRNGTIFNVGTAADNSLVLGPNSESVFENATVNVAGAFGVASPTHVIKTLLDGATITTQTIGNYSDTRAGFDLGFSSSTNATSMASTIVIQNANTGTGGDYRTPLGFNITETTVRFGNATTTAAQVFRIRGVVDNVMIDPAYNHTLQLFGTSTFVSSTAIPSGAILDLSGNGLTLKDDLDITAGATLIATTTGSTLTFSGTIPQALNIDGTLADGYIRSIVINNSSGATPAVAINDDFTISNSLFLTFGSLGGTGVPTLGNSSASTIMTVTRVNGSLLSQPIISLDVLYNVTYNSSLAPTVTSHELPSDGTETLTINDVTGVLLNATTTAETLVLTNGVLTTAPATSLIVSGTNPTDVTGGAASTFVNGKLVRTFPATLAAGTEYSFPVGKETYNPVTLVDAVRNATTTATVLAHVVAENVDLIPGTGMGEIQSASLWNVGPTDPVDILFEQLRMRFPNRSNLGSGSRIGKADAADGTFNSIGGTASGNSITSDVINSFSYFAIGVTDNTFSGTYTVGASGADFPTITAAVANVDTGGLTGPVVLSLIDATYPSETFPIVINQIAGADATKTLTIKPAAGVSPVISGYSDSGIFKLAGADYISIDGSNNGTSSRDMTITNTNAGYGNAIWLSSLGTGLGATNNAIKNLNVATGTNQTSSNAITVGILSSGTTISTTNDGADNDNNLIQNNYVTKARYGIYLRGASGNPNDGNSILSNLVGPAAFGSDQIGKSGIVVQHQSGVTISSNEVRSVGSLEPQSTSPPNSEDRVGIGLGAENWTPGFFDGSTVTNAVVTGNIIHDIIEENTYSAVGLVAAGAGSPSNNLIANNILYNIRSNGTAGEQGVGIGIHAGSGDKIVFNSIFMEGDIDPGASATATGSHAGIRVTGGSNLVIKNNIISVDLTSNADTINHYAVVAPSFYNWGTGGLDYNDYHVNGSNVQMRVGGIGSVGIALTPYVDLAAWRGNFAGTQDAHSGSFAPDFTSSSDLHLNVGSSNTGYAGIPITGVTTDYDGQTRSVSFPYIGADEVPGFPLVLAPSAPTLAFPADNATGQTTGMTLKWNQSIGATGYQFQLSSSALFETTLVNDSTLTDTTKAVSSLANNTEYFWRVRAYNSAGASPFSSEFSFTTISLPPAAPANLTATPGNHQVTLQWSKNSEPSILRYRIFQGTSPDPTALTDSTSGGVNDTAKTITGLSNGTTYYFRVTAVDSSLAESGYSNGTSATPADESAPVAPAGLVVSDSSSRTITVRWQKSSAADFLRYRIYRGTSPGPTTQADSTSAGAGDTSKIFTNLTDGTRYYLRVTAVDSAGNESGYSNEVNAVPADRAAPAAPQNLMVTDSSSTQIGITWAKNSESDFFQYVIYQGTSPDPATAIDTTSGGATDTSATIPGLTNGTRYYFRVTALDSAGNQSGYSNEVHAAPNAPTGIEDLLSQIPREYSLAQNYPNPFNPSTVIRYGLPERSSVKIEVYDILGRRIALLVDQEQEARYYEVRWNAPVSSGIYFYRIHAVAVANPERRLQQVMKMIMMK